MNHLLLFEDHCPVSITIMFAVKDNIYCAFCDVTVRIMYVETKLLSDLGVV
jgi:uncharacterized Zn finger protein (UPF0148 family)